MTSVIAHRGAARAHEPNSIAAIEAAVALGVDWVALDVRRSADGVVVVHDDAHLSDGRILSEVDADDLAGTGGGSDLGSGGADGTVPLLIDAVEACGSVGVAVVLRNTRDDPGYDPEHRISEGVAALLLSRDPAGVMVTSMNLEALARIRSIAPELTTAWMCFDMLDPASVIERCLSAGHRRLQLHVSHLDRKVVDRVRTAGLVLDAWGVHEADRMEDLAGWGVDGIVTEVPELACQVLGRK